MSNPKVKPSSDPKAILDACTFAAEQKKSERVEKKPEVLARIKDKAVRSCMLRVSIATKHPNDLDAQKTLKCVDGYNKSSEQGRCLVDVIWHAPKSDDAIRSPLFLGYSGMSNWKPVPKKRTGVN